MSTRRYLARLRLARRLDGEELKKELLGIIDEWKNTTNKLYTTVTKGTVERLGSQGFGGWAIDKATGKEVLILEEEVLDNPRQLLSEVTHELSYEAVRDGANGLPALDNESGARNFANDWLELVIT